MIRRLKIDLGRRFEKFRSYLKDQHYIVMNNDFMTDESYKHLFIYHAIPFGKYAIRNAFISVWLKSKETVLWREKWIERTLTVTYEACQNRDLYISESVRKSFTPGKEKNRREAKSDKDFKKLHNEIWKVTEIYKIVVDVMASCSLHRMALFHSDFNPRNFFIYYNSPNTKLESYSRLLGWLIFLAAY